MSCHVANCVCNAYFVPCSTWDFGKLLCLKLANVIILYIVKRYVQLAEKTECTASIELCKCPLSGMGYQFFYLIFTDLVVRE